MATCKATLAIVVISSAVHLIKSPRVPIPESVWREIDPDWKLFKRDIERRQAEAAKKIGNFLG